MAAPASAPGPGEEAYTYRNLYVCLTWTDWSGFADALYDAFPQAQYFFNPHVVFRIFPEPPPLGRGEHMLRIRDGEGPFDPDKLTQSEMHFDPGWQPRWFVTGEPINDMLPEPGAYWDITQPRLPAFRFEFSFRKPAEDGLPEFMTLGEYWFFHAPGNRDHLAIGHRVFRLFRQFATNRDQQHVRAIDGAVLATKKVSPFWIGNDAARWARQNPRRLLAMQDYGEAAERWGYRPA